MLQWEHRESIGEVEMALRYKMTRLPPDVYDALLKKKQRIEERIEKIHNKKVNVKLVDVQRYFIKQNRFEWDENILPFFLKKKSKKRFEGEII